jgi:2-dehydro-3-deoxyphosphogluconate aldolase/(4S)-4-hydroxy-2-oxoglutarate aldolase
MTAVLTAEDVMRLAPVIPVLTVAHRDHAAPLASALVDGGLLALEVTLRTPAGLDAISAMVKARPDAMVGAGTVLDADALKRAVDAGARFIVSPGLTKSVARAAEAFDVPLLAGVATASDIMRGLDLGLKRFKFFPAETSGGAPAIAAFGGPFGDIAFCPTGGITLESAPRYLGMKNVLCVGGTWVAPKDAVEAGDWARITTLAKGAAALTRAALA